MLSSISSIMEKGGFHGFEQSSQLQRDRKIDCAISGQLFNTSTIDVVK